MTKQHCVHFQFLPLGLRTLYTATLLVLGTGYLFAMIYIFESHAGRNGNPMLSVDDLIIAYSGSQSDTKLEAAIKGPMKNMLPAEERQEIIAWVRRGAKKEDFDQTSGKIITNRCELCHSGGNPHIPNLKGYDNVAREAHLDTGMDIFTLVRVSHIHLFGITFIFFIVGSIFYHANIKTPWLKSAIILMPLLAILFDIGSWYVTKFFPPFAWVVMISGGIMGLAFATQWFVSIWQMWFYKMPTELVRNDGVVS